MKMKTQKPFHFFFFSNSPSIEWHPSHHKNPSIQHIHHCVWWIIWTIYQTIQFSLFCHSIHILSIKFLHLVDKILIICYQLWVMSDAKFVKNSKMSLRVTSLLEKLWNYYYCWKSERMQVEEIKPTNWNRNKCVVLWCHCSLFTVHNFCKLLLLSIGDRRQFSLMSIKFWTLYLFLFVYVLHATNQMVGSNALHFQLYN